MRIGGVNNVHNAAKIVMNTGWQNADRYRELFQAISNVLHPDQQNNAQLQSLKWVVDRDHAGEAGFHSVLHGLFYICNNPSRVIIEFQLGGGEKLDLVLLRSMESRGGTHPVGMELKFARAAGDQQQRRTEARNQIEHYAQSGGYKRVTDGDAAVLSDVIFNNGAQGPNTLLSACNVFRVIDLGPGTANDLPGR
ncbi:hypothetical protein [Wolbachia endosymbiont (group B) of Longitarsus flavicornis]|uniref:hypothetical protein n=1 Tax=Wolbachia endosymbiont (group B) of Longitarsus flavicornis TaxID=3066135 RepID=UPI003340F04C